MNSFTTNIEETYNKFLQLNAKEMTGALKHALVAGAKELKKQTIFNLDNSILVKGTSMNDLHEGVFVGKVNGEYGEDLEIKVNIMGKKYFRGRDGRLRWLEKGTQERQNLTKNGSPLQKPRRTGSITGKFFFASAINEVFPLLDSIYLHEIDKAIDKVNTAKI